ncbi:MAG: WD40 repeat domain-containing protein [Anaerolineae bacterium]|nr:WD40 repeat domain-containing protein [Anaerolineae bacterium]
MAWRVHLTNQAILDLNIIPGKPALLAAWTQRDRATFFEVETGTLSGDMSYRLGGIDARQHARWPEFVAGLVAPNQSYLPAITTPLGAILLTSDGRMRVYLVRERELFLEIDGKELKLDGGSAEAFPAIGLDRFLGLIAALDTDGKIHIYQQHIPVGIFDLGLTADEDYQPSIAVAHGGGSIFVSDGRHIVLTDSSGKARKRLDVHYFIRRMACSPNGRMLVTSDTETGVVRLYSGTDLTITHQRHAIDLVLEATQIQLLADNPPMGTAPGPLAVDNQGRIAFAMSGVICLTSLEFMDELPRPQALL